MNNLIPLSELNSNPIYQPPKEWFHEEPEIKFEKNEYCNYYTICRSEESMDLSSGNLWKNAFQTAFKENQINENETLQLFYDELLKTGYNEIKPPKKWLVMKVNDFIKFVLDDLHFYWLSAKKKKFIGLFINFYIQKSENIKILSKNYKKLEWNRKTKRLE